mmetsp:Transcript_27334/g.26378  ORF Transcript_27334/g.26378 Transcript_27334/m.26378 type:complete len:234 (-) Transcript_27334:1196-1897(-)
MIVEAGNDDFGDAEEVVGVDSEELLAVGEEALEGLGADDHALALELDLLLDEGDLLLDLVEVGLVPCLLLVVFLLLQLELLLELQELGLQLLLVVEVGLQVLQGVGRRRRHLRLRLHHRLRHLQDQNQVWPLVVFQHHTEQWCELLLNVYERFLVLLGLEVLAARFQELEHGEVHAVQLLRKVIPVHILLKRLLGILLHLRVLELSLHLLDLFIQQVESVHTSIDNWVIVENL